MFDSCEALEHGGHCNRWRYFFFFFCGVWERALPAADFDFLLVRPSLSVFDAAFAAVSDVVFMGFWAWDRALAAAVLDAFAVFELLRVFEAFVAASSPVVFGFAFAMFALRKVEMRPRVRFVESFWTSSLRMRHFREESKEDRRPASGNSANRAVPRGWLADRKTNGHFDGYRTEK
jgi:hypothetical protein